MNSYINIIRFGRALLPLLVRNKDVSKEELLKQSKNLRETIQSLGATYIKFGQLLSVRYDIFKRDTCHELQKLLDSVDECDFQEIVIVLQRELGVDYERRFATFETKPIAVASLAQVHKATLKNGDIVAVKVQKPGIESTIRSDIRTIKRLVSLISHIPQIKRLSLPRIVSEFEQWTLAELDFAVEAANVEKFAEIFEDDPSINAPKVYREFTTQKILVTKFIPGINLRHVMEGFARKGGKEIRMDGIILNRDKLIETAKNSIWKQIFVERFVHGDPHPSNVILQSSDKWYYIDFGIVAHLTEVQLKYYRQMVIDLLQDNREGVVKGLLALDQEPGAETIRTILKHVDPLFDRMATVTTEEYSTTRLLIDIMYEINSLGVQLPMFLVILSKVMATYEGMLHAVKPHSSILTEYRSIIDMELKRERRERRKSMQDSDGVLEEVSDLGQDLYGFVKELPRESIELLRDLRLNGLKVKVANGSKEEKSESSDSKYLVILGLAGITYFGLLLAVMRGFSMTFGKVGIEFLLVVSWVAVLVVGLYRLMRD